MRHIHMLYAIVKIDDSEVQIVPLTEDLESSVLQITVDESQNGFHPSIRSSIDLARDYDDAQLLAVLVRGEVCGFALYGVDFETGKWKVFRLAVDKHHQGRGIGKRAMLLILDQLQHEKKAQEVLFYDMGKRRI